MTNSKPILVTGSPRSGTTWVGRMISLAPSVRYIHEPFNISRRSCACGVKFDHWFYYVSKENEANFREHIEHTIGLPTNIFNLLNVISEIRTTKRLRLLRNYAKSFLIARPLMKDPLAVFSAEWLASAFDMNVIVLIRHPAAVVSSYKRLNWAHPFSHFLDQPLLMEEHLFPFEAEIRDFANNEYDLIDQAALLWKLIHYMIIKYQHIYEDWIFVRHKDLSRDTVSGFQTIFKKINLAFSEQIKDTIRDFSYAAHRIEPENHYSLRRNSSLNIWDWKSRLTLQEIERIRTQVEDVSSAFYTDEDW